LYTTNTLTTTVLRPLFHDKLENPVPETIKNYKHCPMSTTSLSGRNKKWLDTLIHRITVHHNTTTPINTAKFTD